MPMTPQWGGIHGDSYSDGSDVLAQAGAWISFQHLPTGKVVYFKAFITAFNETFTSDWSQESVYGRADPIYMFKQTKRNVNLAFQIPAASHGEAQQNLADVQQLAQFLYPTYVKQGDAQTITQSPLIRLKVINLLQSSADATFGLLGAIESIAIDHGLAADDGVIELMDTGPGILSKLIEVNLNFSAIHEHALGWTEDGAFSTPTFPYSATAPTAVPAAVTPGEENADDLEDLPDAFSEDTQSDEQDALNP